MKVYRIEYSARSEWERMYRELAFERLDGLTGAEFERRLAILFEQQGYRVSETPGSGDQGADLVLSCGESPKSRIAIQAKRHRGKVGNGAVQELLGGMTFYGCERGIVVTTSGFTKAARALAARAGKVELWDRQELHKRFTQTFPVEVPRFSWRDYEELKASFCRLARGPLQSS